MDIAIVPTTPEHIESFHRALDIVARERKYLALLEAPPLTQTREFIMGLIRNGGLQFVALADGEVVGWCDIQRHGFPSRAHRGTLGMGIVPAYRGRGIGLRLIRATLAQARAAGFVRVELDVHADKRARDSALRQGGLRPRRRGSRRRIRRRRISRRHQYGHRGSRVRRVVGPFSLEAGRHFRKGSRPSKSALPRRPPPPEPRNPIEGFQTWRSLRRKAGR